MAETISVTFGGGVGNVLTITGNTSGDSASFSALDFSNASYYAERTRNPALSLAPNHVNNWANTPSNYVAPTPQYIVRISFKDRLRAPLLIRLSQVSNQPGWPNTLNGAKEAVVDIMAIIAS